MQVDLIKRRVVSKVLRRLRALPQCPIHGGPYAMCGCKP